MDLGRTWLSLLGMGTVLDLHPTLLRRTILPFVNPYVTDCPRWLSIADSSSSASLQPMETSIWDTNCPTADLPMERFTLDASGPVCLSITRFTLCILQAMECSFTWKTPTWEKDLPMERFTLGVWGCIPFTIRVAMSKFHHLFTSLQWKTLVGIAPCTYSVYKAVHRLVLLVVAVAEVYFSPRQVSAAHRSCKGFLFPQNPKAKFCNDLFCSQLPTSYQQQMKFTGFASKSLNKLIHSLNGNYVCFEISTPKFRSTLWKTSFSLPNGMIVFDYSFYGKNKLWMKYYRRGLSFEMETDRPASPRLYGIMLRSIAPRGGGPGSRWTYLQAYGRSWKTSAQRGSSQSQGHKPPIYIMTTHRVMTTFTLWTTATTFTLCLIFQYRVPLRPIRSKAATKIDALSGERHEDIDQHPPMLDGWPPEKVSNKRLAETSDNGNLNARIPPCGHTEARILIP